MSDPPKHVRMGCGYHQWKGFWGSQSLELTNFSSLAPLALAYSFLMGVRRKTIVRESLHWRNFSFCENVRDVETNPLSLVFEFLL